MADAPHVKKRRFGRTGLEISEIGYGAWGIGGAQWLGGEDRQSLAALERAFSLGINFVDTALAYGEGHSERLVAHAVKSRKNSIIVATKVPPKNLIWPARLGIPMEEVFPADYVVECMEASLKNLERDSVDLQQFHVWNSEWLKQEGWQEGIERIKRAGKTRFIGISVNDHQPSSVIPALRTGLIDTIQVIYNVFDQSPEDELFGVCRELDIGVIARVPFDEGSLTGMVTPETKFPPGDFRNLYFKDERKREVWERIERMRRDLGDAESLPRTALRFCLSHPAVTTAIPGMRSERHVEGNASASTAGALSPETLDILRRHRWVRNYYSE